MKKRLWNTTYEQKIYVDCQKRKQQNLELSHYPLEEASFGTPFVIR